MLYPLSVQPYLIKEPQSFSCKYGDYPSYSILSIDRESYIIGATVDNSDEGQVPVGKLVYNLQVGRYCSIASGLYFLIGRGKNYHNVTTSAAKVFDNIHQGYNNHGEHGSVIIQNDVWIGSKASVMGGVTIHNGAIVAARSHVVKDVPPYAIVGGNPAKIIGYRFESKIVEQLQKIQWWYWDQKKIEENAIYFNEDIETFCEKFYPEAEQEIKAVKDVAIKSTKDRYLMVVDDEDNYSVLPDVLDEFLLNYKQDDNKELVLVKLEDNAANETGIMQELKELQRKVAENTEIKCAIMVEQCDIEKVKRYMPAVKHLIINRRMDTIQLMCYAEMYGENIEIISGVDAPVFGGAV